jgi:glycosyltransferase involved in cell wall biosynthesis
MRILQVIHDFVPRHVAGSELYCYYLSGALAARHAVHIFFTEFDSSRPQYSYRRSMLGQMTCHEVVHNHEYRTFDETYVDRNMDRRFDRILETEKPDVVHLHHLMNHSLNYPRLAKRRRIPVLFTLHDYWLSCLNHGQRLHPDHGLCRQIDVTECADCVSEFPVVPTFVGAMRRSAVRVLQQRSGAGSLNAGPPNGEAALTHTKAVYRSVLKRFTPRAKRIAEAQRRLEATRAACADVDLFLAPSRFLRQKLIDFGLPGDRVVHSPNGMRTDLLQLQVQPSVRATRFGYVGSVAHHKGVHVLIEAFTKLMASRTGCPIELRIHGNLGWFPSYAAHLRSLAGSAPVSFLGEFDNARAGDVYADLDVIVIPSIWWENAPLTLFEARLAGRPVIVSDCGSLPDLIDTQDAVFRSGDSDDLARCMAAYAERPRPHVTVSSGGSAVHTITEDAAQMERRYERLIEAVSAQSARALAGSADR